MIQHVLNTNAPLRVGIVGLGMVGDPLRRYLEGKGFVRGKTLFCLDADRQKGFQDAIEKAHLIFVCVPTPMGAHGECDTSIVESVVKKYARKNNVMVIKSTIIPGTAEMLAKKYNANVLFNPEFLTESRAWEDFIHPDRQIVGFTKSARQYTKMALMLLPQAFFSSPGALDAYTFWTMNATEAEIGKYAANVFGALKVTFANIIADYCTLMDGVLCEKQIDAHVSYDNVRLALMHDARIGGAWLDVHRGGYRGFGGYCFPKDTSAFIVSMRSLIDSMGSDDAMRPVYEKGLLMFEAMYAYNEALLKSQGVDVASISKHDHELRDGLSCPQNQKSKKSKKL
jgi:UDP-glucose 6-dehydrogenase